MRLNGMRHTNEGINMYRNWLSADQQNGMVKWLLWRHRPHGYSTVFYQIVEDFRSNEFGQRLWFYQRWLRATFLVFSFRINRVLIVVLIECHFVDNYHGFLCSFYNGGADGDHRDQLAKEDYFYAYTLLLNFVCVKRRDKDMQRICNNMEKAQKTMIANVFRGLLRLDYYPPCGIQLVIEEAGEACRSIKIVQFVHFLFDILFD